MDFSRMKSYWLTNFAPRHSCHCTQRVQSLRHSISTVLRKLQWLESSCSQNFTILATIRGSVTDLLYKTFSDYTLKAMSVIEQVICVYHSQLSVRDRLIVLRQIVEALIHLKNLGIVHTTVSSYSIYLADPDHAKLANFEHALLWRSWTKAQDRTLRAIPSLIEWCERRGWWKSETRLSEEEIVHLAAWLAPEVVLLSRSLELEVESEAQMVSLHARGGGGFDSAHHSIFGSSDADGGKPCILTPAADMFGVARVMQELLEPHCIHRFRRIIPTTSKRKSMGELGEAEERRLHFYLRPVIKKALRREFTARGEIEDLHITIVQALRWSESEKENQSDDKVTLEKPRPLNTSSPISKRQQIKLEEKSVPKAQTTSLTKEQYIEMVAIPCDPLGPGRSRPLVPWRSPSAPAHLPYPSSTTTSSAASSASNLTPSSEHVSGLNSVIDRAGKWIKIISDGNGSSLHHGSSHSTSGHINVKTIFATNFENKSKQYSKSQAFALSSPSPFLKSDLKVLVPKDGLSDAERKCIKTRQEAKNITISSALGRVRRQLEDVYFQKTREVMKTT
ncbi:hypothetical protein TcWFU_004746 [Taenia crassiceps]|uniref:Protein kinase domain-containing protein n=1 Tax=Taenia crassiceps TaxID=6207 RepID=A0ABR4QR23_9CEST